MALVARSRVFLDDARSLPNVDDGKRAGSRAAATAGSLPAMARRNGADLVTEAGLVFAGLVSGAPFPFGPPLERGIVWPSVLNRILNFSAF